MAATSSTDTDTATQLRIVLGRLSRRLRPTAAALGAGLTPTKVTVLLYVVRGGQTRLSDIAAAEGLNPTMLSRVIGDLVEAGLVERESDAQDRRAAWVRITPAGRRLAERIRRERTEAVSRALDGLTAADIERIERAIPALEQLVEQLGEPRP